MAVPVTACSSALTEWSGHDGACQHLLLDLPEPVVLLSHGMNRLAGLKEDEAATIADERASMDDATFARERLGVWGESTGYRVISAETWAKVAQPNLTSSGGEVALPVDVSPDRSVTSMAASGWTGGEHPLPYVDVIETRQGEPGLGGAQNR